MFGFAVFVYGFLASFVLSSIKRNTLAGVPNPPMVTAVGWGLMSMSLVLAALLAGWAFVQAFSGQAV